MNIIVIGSGMYVSGRGTKEQGTILPAIFEFKRKTNKFIKLTIIGKNAKNLISVKKKVKEISKLSGLKIDCDYFPKNNLNDDKAYLKAIDAVAKPACGIVAVPDHLHFEVKYDGGVLGDPIQLLGWNPCAITGIRSGTMQPNQKCRS